MYGGEGRRKGHLKEEGCAMRREDFGEERGWKSRSQKKGGGRNRRNSNHANMCYRNAFNDYFYNRIIYGHNIKNERM